MALLYYYYCSIYISLDFHLFSKYSLVVFRCLILSLFYNLPEGSWDHKTGTKSLVSMFVGSHTIERTIGVDRAISLSGY